MFRLAAALTVDETKKAFAKWKAFSLSAVPSSSDYSEVPAITLAPGIDELLQPTDSSRTSRHVRFLPTPEVVLHSITWQRDRHIDRLFTLEDAAKCKCLPGDMHPVDEYRRRGQPGATLDALPQS